MRSPHERREPAFARKSHPRNSRCRGLTVCRGARLRGREGVLCLLLRSEGVSRRSGLHSHKHSGVHALFGEHFAKPGFVDPKFHRILLDAFESRLQADYEVDPPVPAAQAAIFIDYARQFLLEANRFFGS